MLELWEDCHGMVEMDTYSSVDWSDSRVHRDRAEMLRPNSSEARRFSRLAASFAH